MASTNDFGKDKHQIQLYFCEIRTRSIFLGPAETVTGSVRWPAGGRVSDWLTSHRGLRTRVWTTAKRQIVTRLCVADHWLFITLFRRPRHKRLLNEPVHAATGLSGRTWTSLNRAGDVHYPAGGDDRYYASLVIAPNSIWAVKSDSPLGRRLPGLITAGGETGVTGMQTRRPVPGAPGAVFIDNSPVVAYAENRPSDRPAVPAAVGCGRCFSACPSLR